MICSFWVMIGERLLRVADWTAGQPTAQLAIHFVNSFSGHRFDQEVGQRPDQRIDPIWREGCRTRGKTAMRVGGKGAHLILKSREHAQVVYPALLIERRNRFCAGYLSTGRPHGDEGHVWLDHSQGCLDHVAAIVHLGYDPIGPVHVISRNSCLGPFRGLVAARGIGENPTPSRGIFAGDYDAGFIRPLSRTHGWIDSDYNSD